MGEYFNIDPNLIRVIFVLLAVFGGSGFLIYIVLWIILPSESQVNIGKDHIRQNLHEFRDKVQQFAHDLKGSAKSRDNDKSSPGNLVAVVAILLGVIFLLQNLGFGEIINIGRLWPIILIVLGISLFLKK